jgi:hypothetical protein
VTNLKKSLSTYVEIALPRLQSVGKCRRESFCFTLDHGWERFPAEWGDEHLSALFKTARREVHFVYVIHNNMANFEK